MSTLGLIVKFRLKPNLCGSETAKLIQVKLMINVEIESVLKHISGCDS